MVVVQGGRRWLREEIEKGEAYYGETNRRHGMQHGTHDVARLALHLFAFAVTLRCLSIYRLIPIRIHFYRFNILRLFVTAQR